jgi:membrane protease YdiL (CAAX protease family)
MSVLRVPTAARWSAGASLPGAMRPWLPAAAPLVGLVAIVAVRVWATRSGVDALGVGLAFGIALVALALAGRGSVQHAAVDEVPMLPSVTAGIGFGLALVGLVAAGAPIGGTTVVPGLGRPAAPFLPWAAITILVASAEEALLRGRLFDVVRRAGGVIPAIAITTIAFAVMHVPLYGWHVVPLDLAVGLGLGGLRLVTGRVAAPAAAHAVADLATWWL